MAIYETFITIIIIIYKTYLSVQLIHSIYYIFWMLCIIENIALFRFLPFSFSLFVQ